MAVISATVRTFAAVLTVGLYVLLCGPPILVWTLISRRPTLLFSAGALGVRAGFWLAAIRLEIRGAEHMQPGAVYACNHSSNVDAPAVFLALRPLHPRVRVLYKAELRRLPVLVWVFDVAGFVPVERANKSQSWPAVDHAAAALAQGDAFFIFPEGTRSRTDELLPFKKGGFIMAIKAQAPVVPVAVKGGRQAMRKGSALIWPATVTVTLGPAIPTQGTTIDERDRLVTDVRASIDRLRHGS